jgi:hypothetical protein
MRVHVLGHYEREQLVNEMSLADASKRASAAVVLLG